MGLRHREPQQLRCNRRTPGCRYWYCWLSLTWGVGPDAPPSPASCVCAGGVGLRLVSDKYRGQGTGSLVSLLRDLARNYRSPYAARDRVGRVARHAGEECRVKRVAMLAFKGRPAAVQRAGRWCISLRGNRPVTHSPEDLATSVSRSSQA